MWTIARRCSLDSLSDTAVKNILYHANRRGCTYRLYWDHDGKHHIDIHCGMSLNECKAVVQQVKRMFL